jgi:hypothetical protein
MRTFVLRNFSQTLNEGITHNRVLGGCIEGVLGSKYVKEGGYFCQTVTTLDIPTKSGATISSHSGKELPNFASITQEHASFGQKGTLKETIIQNFPHDNFFHLQVYIILYFLEKFIILSGEENETQTKRMHVQIHRGGTNGPIHLQLLKGKLITFLIKQDLLNSCVSFSFSKSGNEWTFQTKTNLIIMSFGFGYEHSQLEPPTIGSLQLVDFYYSVSLIVGFDSELTTGQTNIPQYVTQFDTSSVPPVLHCTREKYKNFLTDEWEYIEMWIQKKGYQQVNIVNNGILLQINGIYNPNLDDEIKLTCK